MKSCFKSRILYILTLTIFALPSKAQLPYFDSFRYKTAPSVQFGGVPTAFLTASTGLDPDGDGYLRLTGNNQNLKGFIYSNNDLPSTDGLVIQFEYYTYGGDGADGICFFLFDATANPFNIGGFGGSLGYAQYNTDISPNSPGISKGYLGIGIDEYGNFSNPIEGRQGGITGPIANGLSPNSVTLRGKGNGSAQTPENYKYLTSARSSDFGFKLVDGGRFPDPNSEGYRKAYVELVPNPAGGYNITVIITRGGTPNVSYTMIDNYYYPENAPAVLRYGLSSSTGNSKNFHEIRNVLIYSQKDGVPVASTAVDDIVNECSGKSVTFDVTVNDFSNNRNSTTNTLGTIRKNSIDLNPFEIGGQKTFFVDGKGTFVANDNGTITYTPLSSSVGGDVSVKYTINDNYGSASNVATFTIKSPTTSVFANAGADILSSIATNTTSTTLTGNLPSGSTGLWSQVSGPLGSTIINPNSATTTVNNLGLGRYVFRWTLNITGQCALSDDVAVVVNAIPVALNDVENGIYNTPIFINIIANDTDRDGNNTIDKKTVVIKTNPQHGSVIVDPITGIVTYTPNDGYSGPDSFTYTIKDNSGAESNEATVQIEIPIAPKIGLAKSLEKIDKLSDGTFNLTFLFTIKNFSDITLEKLSLKDDLAITFSGETFRVISLKAISPNTFITNNAYNGRAFTEMLLGNNQLLSGATATIELMINVNFVTDKLLFTNTAFIEATSVVDGIKVTDQSTDGVKPDPDIPGDISPSKPTPIDITNSNFFIPGGFSPNGDLVNDYFIIKNSGGLPVKLEIFNRWGNAVYKSSDYKNDWDGKCEIGVYAGQYLPEGTYYYIVEFSSKKYVGYLTLKR